MIQLNEENADFQKGLKINLVFNPFKINREQVDALSKELFEKYKDIIYTSSVVLVKKQKYNKREDGTWAIDVDHVIRATPKVKKFAMAWISKNMRPAFKNPTREMTFHEIGVDESKKVFFSKTSKFNVNRTSSYSQLTNQDFFPFLKEHGLVEIFDNQNKPFHKVYCFSDKYFRDFLKYLRFKVTVTELEELYQHYVKQDLKHLLPTNYYEMLEKLNSPSYQIKKAKDLLNLQKLVNKKKLGLT